MFSNYLFEGMKVTFIWEDGDGGHNINQITEEQYNSCNVENSTKHRGDLEWTAPTTTVRPYSSQNFWFACGRGFNDETKTGYHCNHGMRAKIVVNSKEIPCS